MAFYSTLDASLFRQGSDPERSCFAKDIVTALKKTGFVKLRNHGISPDILKDIFNWQRRFFDLPLSQKASCAHKGGPVPVRGFNGYSQEKSSKLSPGNESLLDAKDARESLDIGPLCDSRYPNQWPAEDFLPTFREHIESYYIAFQQTATYLLQAIELGLDLPSGSMISRAFPDASELRLNHYPSISATELTTKNTRRIWPHTDLGILSLLIQDNEGGLEFQDRENPEFFLPVLNEEPADLIVNVSDMLGRWTNGVLPAGLHRVVPPQSSKERFLQSNMDAILPDRYSVVFLFRPGEESSAGPMKEFVSNSRPAVCDEISALAYLERMNALVYG